MEEDWQRDLEHWLEPYLQKLGNKTRRRMCPAYIAGLIGPGDRKSIQPMAARADALSYDRLHHFIGAGIWDSAPLEATLWRQADELVGGDKGWLIIDDTALPKKGKASVGVAPQYATVLGKNANCQTLVSVTLASGEVPVMLGLRLYLPESWTSDTARMERAGVPEDFQSYRTKPDIAIEEIDRVIAAGVRFGCVLADAGYGLSAPFRQALSARGLRWAVGIPRHQKVYPADVQLIFPVAGRGRPRVRHVPDVKSRAAHAMLEDAKWRQVSWRRGTKGRLTARFAAMRGPLDRAANALDGRDDPNRGPLDRAANALHGHDDPNRGPLDRAANAISGGSGGVNAAIGGSPSSTSGTYDATVVSAVFDTQEEAERAVSELRNAGVSDSALSVIAQTRGTLTTRDVDGEITDEEHTNILRGILGGGALGAGLGVLALAIPGVGPLAALGAIAASAVPEALAIGAVAGAVVGTFNEVLLKHGVSEEDAAYYGDQMKSGGVLVTVTGQGSAGERARDILYRNGGHSSSRAKAAAI